jgi:hypothetical protein
VGQRVEGFPAHLSVKNSDEIANRPGSWELARTSTYSKCCRLFSEGTGRSSALSVGGKYQTLGDLDRHSSLDPLRCACSLFDFQPRRPGLCSDASSQAALLP